MNDEKEDEHNRFAKAMFPLFKEFGARMAQTRADVLRIYTEFHKCIPDPTLSAEDRQRTEQHQNHLRQQFYATQNAAGSLVPAMTKLARQVSQRLQHTKPNDIARIELEARLAAFENDIQYTRDFIHSLLL